MKYIYILGYGRSGSTLIESYLTNFSDSLAVGEVKYLVERGLVFNESCSCGKIAKECGFWSKVINNIKASCGASFFHPIRLNKISKSIETYESTVLFIKNILLKGKGNKTLYLESQQSILEAIDKASGGEVIIDSSKIPARLYWLKKELNIDPLVLFVVRDPRAVAWSWSRVVERKEAGSMTPDNLKFMPRFGFISSVLRWGINTFISLLVLKLTNVKFLLVKYEDFVVENDEEILKIENFLSEILNVHSDHPSLRIHSISGNPKRITGGLKRFKLDEEWKEGLPRWKRVIGYLLLFPLMLKFGYGV